MPAPDRQAVDAAVVNNDLGVGESVQKGLQKIV